MINNNALLFIPVDKEVDRCKTILIVSSRAFFHSPKFYKVYEKKNSFVGIRNSDLVV